MKKSLLSLAGIAMLSAVFGWVANAQLDISELFSEWTPLVDDAYSKVLNEYDSKRWYSDASSVECAANNGVEIKSPVIEDSFMDNAKIYRLFVSPYRVDQLKLWDSSIDTSKVIMKEVTIDDGASEVKFNVSSADVDPNTIYYGFVLPIDMYDWVWTPSKETCFQLNSNICLQDSDCDTISLLAKTEDEEHWAANCIGMDMANVSHTTSGDTVTLTWTAIDGDVVEIAIFDPEAELYRSLGAVSMSDEKFDYKMEWNGEQVFRLTNGCKELIYKADAAIWENPTIVTPATWPAENVLYIAIAAIILYGAYVVFFRKAENK